MVKKLKHIFLVLNVFTLVSNLIAQNTAIDSFKTILKLKPTDSIKMNTLNDLAWELNANNSDTALLLTQQALVIAKKNNWKIGIAQSIQLMGSIQTKKGNHSLAIDKFNLAITYWNSILKSNNIKEKIIAFKSKGNALSNIGIVYWTQGNYPKAIEYSFLALEIAKKSNNQNETARFYGNIGIIYYDQGIYNKSILYYNKALKMHQKLGNKFDIASCLGNLGVVFKKQGNSTKALYYYLSAFEKGKEIGEKIVMANSLGNIGIIYKEKGDSIANIAEINQHKSTFYDLALDYFFKDLELNESLGDKYGIAIVLGNIGSLYCSIKKYTSAEKYLLNALQMSKEINAPDIIKDQYEGLSALYEKTNKHELALQNFIAFTNINDSLFNIEKENDFTRKELNFEFEQKEITRIAEQEKKDIQVLKEKQKQKIIIYVVSIGFSFVSIFVLFLVRTYRQKQKATHVLIAQKEKEEEQKQLIELKNKEVMDSIIYAKRIQDSLLPNKKHIQKDLDRLIKQN